MNWKLGWKTITGAVVALLAYLSQPDVLAVLPAKVASAIAAIGAFVTVLGLRHAIAKVTPQPIAGELISTEDLVPSPSNLPLPPPGPKAAA